MPVPVLHTRRLCLRPFTVADGAALARLHALPQVYRWLGLGRADGPADARQRLQRYCQDYPAPCGFWAVCLDGDTRPFIGTVLLKPLPFSADAALPAHTPPDIEIGWHLHPDYWGRAYAFEAATAVLAQAASGGLRRVWAVAYPDNVRSLALMRRLGMRDQGLSRRYYDVQTRVFVWTCGTAP